MFSIISLKFWVSLLIFRSFLHLTLLLSIVCDKNLNSISFFTWMITFWSISLWATQIFSLTIFYYEIYIQMNITYMPDLKKNLTKRIANFPVYENKIHNFQPFNVSLPIPYPHCHLSWFTLTLKSVFLLCFHLHFHFLHLHMYQITSYSAYSIAHYMIEYVYIEILRIVTINTEHHVAHLK